MTTTGYGDVYPKSLGGRIIGMIVCVWGMFLTSFFTVTLTQFFNFTHAERKSFDLLRILKYRESI
jgi:hypothetical protein